MRTRIGVGVAAAVAIAVALALATAEPGAASTTKPLAPDAAAALVAATPAVSKDPQSEPSRRRKRSLPLRRPERRSGARPVCRCARRWGPSRRSRSPPRPPLRRPRRSPAAGPMRPGVSGAHGPTSRRSPTRRTGARSSAAGSPTVRRPRRRAARSAAWAGVTTRSSGVAQGSPGSRSARRPASRARPSSRGSFSIPATGWTSHATRGAGRRSAGAAESCGCLQAPDGAGSLRP